MQRLEVSGAVRPIYGSLGIKRLKLITHIHVVLSLRIIGAMSLPHMPAWCDFTFTLLLPSMIINY